MESTSSTCTKGCVRSSPPLAPTLMVSEPSLPTGQNVPPWARCPATRAEISNQADAGAGAFFCNAPSQFLHHFCPI